MIGTVFLDSIVDILVRTVVIRELIVSGMPASSVAMVLGEGHWTCPSIDVHHPAPSHNLILSLSGPPHQIQCFYSTPPVFSPTLALLIRFFLSSPVFSA